MQDIDLFPFPRSITLIKSDNEVFKMLQNISISNKCYAFVIFFCYIYQI